MSESVVSGVVNTMLNVWNAILDFNDRWFPKWRKTDPIYYSNALAGESGEVCNAIKHMVGGGTNKMTPEQARLKAVDETVDVLIYMTLLLERLGVDQHGFIAAFKKKMTENEHRMEEELNKSAQTIADKLEKQGVRFPWPGDMPG